MECHRDSKRAEKEKQSLLDSESLSMGVLSDDFAAVDLREDYANLSLPKEAKFKRCRTIKTNERKPCAAEKRQPIPKAVQRGRLRAAALSVWFSVLFLLSFSWRVLGCGARQRGALVYANHTPRCQIDFLLIKAIKKAYKH